MAAVIILHGREWGTAAEIAQRLGGDITPAMVRGEEDPPTVADRLFRDTWSALFGVPDATDPGDRP